jgi:hypothetical protein
MESLTVKKTSYRLSEKAKEWLIFSICLICIFLFLYAAYSKIADHRRFENGLSKVALIRSLASYIAWIVPLAEILISTLLIIPRTYKLGLSAFVGLMAVFTVYIISMLLWATKLPCHCGGVIEKLSWIQHVWFNLAFIAIAVFALWLSRSNTN